MARILPPLTELAKPYWEGCREGVLRLQRCSACDRHQFYPRNICSHCGGGKLEWDTVSGQGKIASFTTVHRAISDSYTAPYTVALIDLEEGPRMMSNIVGTDRHSVVIGAAVIVDFETWSEDISLPVFRLEETGGQP